MIQVMRNVKLSKITFLHLIVIHIVAINIKVICFLNHSIASIRKELQM